MPEVLARVQLSEAAMDENDRRFIEELFVAQTQQFQQNVGIIAENFDHKLALVSEGHQSLSGQLERVEASLERLETNLVRVEANLGAKIDKISAEVTAHRSDPDAHRGLYRVKES